jgi:hypothetical protein
MTMDQEDTYVQTWEIMNEDQVTLVYKPKIRNHYTRKSCDLSERQWAKFRTAAQQLFGIVQHRLSHQDRIDRWQKSKI